MCGFCLWEKLERTKWFAVDAASGTKLGVIWSCLWTKKLSLRKCKHKTVPVLWTILVLLFHLESLLTVPVLWTILVLLFHLESLFNASICVKFQGGATFKAASIIQRLTRNNGARIFVVSNFGSWLLALGFFRLSLISAGASSWVTPKGIANSGKVDKFGQHLVMP